MPLQKPPELKVKEDAWRHASAIRTILLEDYDVAYVRLRKNASSSVQSCLNYCGKVPAGEKYPTKPKMKYLHGQSVQMQLRDEGKLVFCIIRDPIDRLAGAYRYFKGKNVHRYVPDADNQTFDEFIRDAINFDPKSLDEHVAPQTIQITQDGKLTCNFVLRHSHLAEDWQALTDYAREEYGCYIHPLAHENDHSSAGPKPVPSIETLEEFYANPTWREDSERIAEYMKNPPRP